MPLQRHLRAVCHILGIFEEPLIEVYFSLPPRLPQVATLIQIGPSVLLQDAPPQDDVCSLVLLLFHGSSKKKPWAPYYLQKPNINLCHLLLVKLFGCDAFWLNLDFFNQMLPLVMQDNTSPIRITSNLVFHEWTKHIEADCHSIKQHFVPEDISLPQCPLSINCQIYSQKQWQNQVNLRGSAERTAPQALWAIGSGNPVVLTNR